MAATQFIDTSFLVAVLDSRDAKHGRAVQLLRGMDRRRIDLVTTDAVLIEFANYFCRSPLRRHAIVWIGAIRTDREWNVVRLDAAVIAIGEKRYRDYDDKQWSLTDCISMEVMQKRGITEIATTDRHFLQAGFRPLLR